jgi:hypothetical protein
MSMRGWIVTVLPAICTLLLGIFFCSFAPDEGHDLIELYQQIPDNDVSKKLTVLKRIGKVESRAVEQFLSHLMEKGAAQSVRALAFRLWAERRTPEVVVEYLDWKKKFSDFDTMVQVIPQLSCIDRFSYLKKLYEEGFRRIAGKTMASLNDGEAFAFLHEEFQACRKEGEALELLTLLLSMDEGNNRVFLEGLLSSRFPFARAEGAARLIRSDEQYALKRVKSLLNREIHSKVRSEVLRALAELGTDKAAQVILGAYGSQPREALHEMVQCLSRFPVSTLRRYVPADWYMEQDPWRYALIALAFTASDRSPELIARKEQALLEKGETHSLPDLRLISMVALSRIKEEMERYGKRLESLLSSRYFNEQWELLHLVQCFRIDDDIVTAHLLSLLRGSKWEIKIKAAEVVSFLDLSSAIPILVECLDSGPLLVRIAVIKAMGRISDGAVVPILIERLARESGRAAWEIARALKKHTGTYFGIDFNLWSKWLKLRSGAGAGVPLTVDSWQLESKTDTRYSFYGLPLDSHAVIFVLDVSGSMQGVKIKRLREEFSNTLSQLSDDHSVNVIFFNNAINKWRDRLLPGRVRDKRYGTSFGKLVIQVPDPAGGTNLYGALMAALEDEEADTVVLLTDGEPTTGAIVDSEAILDEVMKRNRLVQTTIHTIAIGSADPGLLKNLADRTGGLFKSLATGALDGPQDLGDPEGRPPFALSVNDGRIPYTCYPEHYKAAKALLRGEGDVKEVILDIDNELREVVGTGDFRKMGELFTLRYAADAFHDSGSRDRGMALLLLDNPGWCSRFFHNLDREDDLAGALEVLRRLYSHDPKAFPDRFEFCLAYAMVWDRPAGHWWVDDTAGMEEDTMIRTYRFYLKNERKMRFRPGSLPCELNVFVVGTRLTAAERDWVLKNYKRTAINAEAIYLSVPYTFPSERALSPMHGKGLDVLYTLMNIMKYGGCCVDQAYFTENVFRLFGIPAVLVHGQSYRFEGPEHAWVGVLHQRSRKPAQWDFSAGRYESAWYYRGELNDPTDVNNIMTDSEVKILAACLEGASSISRLEESNFYLDAARWAEDNLYGGRSGFESAEKPEDFRNKLLFDSLKTARYNPKTWRFLSGLALEGKMSEARALYWAEAAVIFTSEKFPDFTVQLLDAFTSCIKNDFRRRRIFDKAYEEMERRRPDLVCDLKAMEGKAYLATGDLRKGLKCFIHPILQFSRNRTLLESSMAQIEKIEAQLKGSKEIIDAYEMIFNATRDKSRKNALISDIRKKSAEKLYTLYKKQGDLKKAKRYERYL